MMGAVAPLGLRFKTQSPDLSVVLGQLFATYCNSCTTLRTLNYGSYGIFLRSMGAAGFISPTVEIRSRFPARLRQRHGVWVLVGHNFTFLLY